MGAPPAPRARVASRRRSGRLHLPSWSPTPRRR